MRRIVSGVFCGLLFIAISCGTPMMKPSGRESCAPLRSTVLIKDGVPYLRIGLPDDKVVVVKLDGLPQGSATTGSATPMRSTTGSATPSSGGSSSLFVEGPCPCQEDPCRPMCSSIDNLVGSGANLCTK